MKRLDKFDRDTNVGGDADHAVPAERLQVRFYNRIAAFDDLLEACKAARQQIRHDDDCAFVRATDCGANVACTCGAAAAANSIKAAIAKAGRRAW
jgi:hypothetical protein